MRTSANDYADNWNAHRMRIKEQGWQRIGVFDSASRRSLWVRIPDSGQERPDKIELCAGREGDDAYVCIASDNPQFDSIWELISTAIYASEN